MDKTRKILIVSSEFPPQPGGIGNHAYNLAKHLSLEGFQVVVLTDLRTKDAREEGAFDKKLGFEVVRVPISSFRGLMYLKRFLNLYQHSEGATNIIATGKFSLWIVALLRLTKKINTLAIVHGTEVNFKNIWLDRSVRTALKKFDRVVVVSKFTQQLLKGRYPNVTIIPNGIDLSEWESNTIPKKPSLGNPSLITVGRTSERKGQTNVIKALPYLIDEFPDIHYHCVGLDPLKEDYMALAKELEVSDFLSFHGAVTDQLLKSLMASAKIAMMLSVEDREGDVEGFGIAILEANALGIPSIGSMGCGLEDAVNVGVSGLLVKPDQQQEIKKAIKEILKDYMGYSRGAKEWASLHDWTFIIKDYLKLFK